MSIAKVTTNYQVTIPKDIRRVKDIKIGDEVLFSIEGDKIDFMKLERKAVIKRVAGIWTQKEDSVEYVKGLRREWDSRLRKQGL
jgi:AbrB family looped-hinge helix DNA binding protein